MYHHPLPTRIRPCVSAVLAALTLTAPVAHATGVKVYLQAPFDYTSGEFDLDEIESYNSEPVYSKSFAIPYGALEPLASQKLKEAVDRTVSGTVVCTDPCPDVSYSVTVASELAFVQTAQPAVSSFGDTAENGVHVGLEGVQTRIRLNVSVHAETWFDSADVPVTIEVLVGAHGAASAKLWPTLSVPESSVFLTLDGKNVDISGLNGEVVELGAELGTLVGFSPLGILVGGPVGGLILGAIGGDVAANEAERRVKAIISNELEGAVKFANSWLKDQLAQQITPTVAQANALKDQLLNKPLPGIGKSLDDLRNDWGLNLDVRSVVSNNTLRTVATTRFSSAAAGGAFNGRVRLPKSQCVYAEINNRIIGHYKFPTGTQAHNTDLASLVGQDCNAVLNLQDLAAAVYLGESPEGKLQSGDGANELPRWAAAGTLAFNGVLQDKGGFYECAFAVNALPAVGITELGVHAALQARITELFPDRERVLHMPIGGFTALFNSELQPYGMNGIVLGGKGPDSAEDCPSEHSGGTGWQKNFDFKSRFDPETCPQCGFQLGFGDLGEVIYMASNPEVFQGVWNLTAPVLANPGEAVGLNPQPLPPKLQPGSQVLVNPAANISVIPQIQAVRRF